MKRRHILILLRVVLITPLRAAAADRARPTTTQSDIVLAAKRATRDIPIVFVVAGDPVANCVVAGMSRPGGNATELTSLNASADAKWLELLKEATPVNG